MMRNLLGLIGFISMQKMKKNWIFYSKLNNHFEEYDGNVKVNFIINLNKNWWKLILGSFEKNLKKTFKIDSHRIYKKN